MSLLSVVFTVALSLCILYLVNHIYQFMSKQAQARGKVASLMAARENKYKIMYEDLKKQKQSVSDAEYNSMLEDITQEVFGQVDRKKEEAAAAAAAAAMEEDLTRLVLLSAQQNDI